MWRTGKNQGKMNRYEQVYNISWVLLAIGICVKAVLLKVWGPDGPGSGLIPFMAGSVIGICGITLFLFEWFRGRHQDSGENFWEHPRAWKRIVGVILGFFVMAFFMPTLGFFLTSSLVMTFLIRLIEPQNLFKVILTAVSSCVPIYLFFNYIFHINLPRGVLPF